MYISDQENITRPAVVIGLCAHGLATARSLWRFGVKVYALEKNTELPGCQTKAAQVHFVDDINGDGLIQALITLHRNVGFTEQPVLFPINDNMVRVIGANWEQLKDFYLLSWAEHRVKMLPLLNKINLEERCETRNMNYPKAQHLHKLEELNGLVNKLQYPLLIKPDRPLSSFKTKLVDSFEELSGFVQAHQQDLPVLLQQWIPGNDNNLVFGGLYLQDGVVVMHYEGRKLRVVPKGTGWSTISESCPDDSVFMEATKYFEGLGLSGPVSVEFKRSAKDGKLWFIEATVGRTDFWLPSSIANGVDFPIISYCLQSKLSVPKMRQGTDVLFYNTPQDIFAPFFGIIIHKYSIISKKMAFPYMTMDDIKPFNTAVLHKIASFFETIRRRLKLLLTPKTLFAKYIGLTK